LTSRKTKFNHIRKNIDSIDSEILTLLKRRITFARDIGRLKDENNRAKWDPLRERQIYERLLKENGTTFPEDSLRTIFHEIITACRLSQRNIEVAYLGPEATFSHLAGVKYFGHSATYKPQESIDDVFSEVEKGRTRYGIVPVENSIEGSVVSTLDSFMKYKVQICGEVQLEISHNLVCRSGNIEDIQTVAPTPNLWPSVGSGCGNICRISRRCRCCPPGAAAQMAANNPNIGAIASSLAIKRYELQSSSRASRIIAATPPVSWSSARDRHRPAVRIAPRCWSAPWTDRGRSMKS